MINLLKREVPDYIEGYGAVRHYQGVFVQTDSTAPRASVITPQKRDKRDGKLCRNLDEVLDKLPLRDGMTVSFHHHLRNGDYVTNYVMEGIAKRGYKDIHLAATGLFACHAPLVPLIENGTISQISVSTFGPGPVAQAISAGKLRKPAILRSHGGRPRAIENGEMHIDIAFIAAPSADDMGNLNGCEGKNACGCLSYVYTDAEFADYVVAVTDTLVAYPNAPIEIHQDKVDYVVTVDAIGNPEGIASGATKVTDNPSQLAVAQTAAELLDQAGYVKNDMSFQTGVGGISLAVAAKLREKMIEKHIVGSFGAGGIHAYFTQMLDEGLLRALWNVQCFDTEAINHLAKHNPHHLIMGASLYGNPQNKGCVVNNLDIMILGGFEVDTDFNLNVITGSNGVIMSASGGNEDCAAGSKIALVVSSLMKKGNRCIIKDRVTTITTPGDTVDGIVTDQGIAINPKRADLLEKLAGKGFPVMTIEKLLSKGKEQGAVDDHPSFGSKIVAVVEYRDGTVIDVVRQVC